MRKKFTMLLASLFLVWGSAWAETVVITNLGRLTDDLSCTVSTASRGGWAVNADGSAFGSTNDHGFGTTVDPTNNQHLFQFKKKDGSYYLYSVHAEKYVNKDKSLSEEAAQAIEFLPQDGGTFVVKFDDTHYINLGGSNQMTIDGWSTADVGNKVTITAVSVDLKTKLSWLVDDIQSSNVFGKIPLQTTDATGAYYLSATVQGDAPIDKAIDNDPSTHYGSTWGAEVGSRHYWQVDLGEGVTLSSFVFSYVTRENGSDTPTQIDIKGSMDGTEFSEIVSLTKDADGLPTAGGASYTSEEIANTNNYRYIRFEVPSTTNNFSKPENPEQEVTIAIAEFSLYDIYNEDLYSDEEIAMQAALDAAKKLLAASNVTDEQYEDAYTAIKMAPVEKPLYPFTVTTDDANPVLYAIKSGRDNDGKTWWYNYDETDGMISLSEYSGTADTQFWFFKEVITNDYAYALQLLPYADKTKAMSYENTDNGAAKIVAKEDGTEGWTNLWLLASTDGQAPYGLQTYDKANYLSNNGGYQNKMGMWNAAPNADSGTAMYIYTPADILQNLIDEAESMLVNTDAVGYLTSASAASLKSAIDNAKAQLANKNYSVVELETAIDNVDIVLPQEGKYYQLISGMKAFPEKKAIYSNGTAPAWKTLDGTDKSFYWTIVPDADGESYTFCNVADGKYLNGTAMELVDEATTTAVTKLKFLAVGEFNIISNDVTMHAYAHGNGAGIEGSIKHYTTGANNASSWMIVEVDHPDLAMEKAALEQRIAELNAIVNNAGATIGEYKEAEAAKLVAPLATAQAVMDGGSAVPSVYTEALKDLNEAVSSFDLTIILPTAGKYYQLRSALGFAETKAVYSDGSNPKWKTLDEYDETFYWQAVENDGGIAFKNAADGKYLNGNAEQSGAWTVSDTPANIDVKIFSKEEDANGYQYGVVIGNWQLHAQGHDSGRGTAGTIVSYNAADPGSASAWYLVEEEKVQAITYVYMYNDTELAREVVKEHVGMPYPAATAILPLGYTATKLEGVVSAEDTEKVIACEFNESAIPFEYYESFDVVEQWYYLKLSEEQNYLYYAEKDLVLDASKTEYAIDNRVAYAWAFVGNPLDGFQVVNKKAAETMGLKAAEDGAVVGEGGDIFKLTPSSDIKDGFYMAATNSEKNQRLNKQSGKVVYWDNADSGSTFTVAQCIFGPIAELKDLIGKADALMETVGDNTGDNIGEYTQATADALAAAIATAKSKIDDPTEADVTALTNAIIGTKITLPTAGKYYQLHSAVAFAETKAVYSDGSNPLWKTLNANDKTFYWEAVENEGGIALKNAADGKYMNGHATQSQAWSVSDTPVSIDVKIFSKEENANGYQYGVVIGNYQLHAEGHGGGSGTAGPIVSYNTDAAGSASAWYLVEVELPQFYTITYNFKHDGDTKYKQTATLTPGAEFPDFSVMLPYGVSLAAEKPAGTVAADKTFDFELVVEKELPFVAAANVDAIDTWYYVQMHANPDATAYLEDNGGQYIEWTDKSVEGSEIDSYLWGYVGDVWSGIKMVNKGTGRAIVSTSGDAVLGDAANATAFIPANSQAGGNWFCLKYPESNYLNAQASKVASWNDNDNGSSFLLTAYKVYALEVPAIGYGTFYSDNKLEIPETVQAYVATSVNAGEVILEQVTGVIPAHTGIIYSGGEGVHNFVVSAATVTAEFETNLLRGTTTKTLITPEAGTTCYVLEEGAIGTGLYIATLTEENGTAFYNNANEAYLLMGTSVEEAEPVLTFRFGKQDGTTIEKAEFNTQLPNVIYDLTGRRILEIVEKGIYIVNGKKVVIK